MIEYSYPTDPNDDPFDDPAGVSKTGQGDVGFLDALGWGLDAAKVANTAQTLGFSVPGSISSLAGKVAGPVGLGLTAALAIARADPTRAGWTDRFYNRELRDPYRRYIRDPLRAVGILSTPQFEDAFGGYGTPEAETEGVAGIDTSGKTAYGGGETSHGPGSWDPSKNTFTTTYSDYDAELEDALTEARNRASWGYDEDYGWGDADIDAEEDEESGFGASSDWNTGGFVTDNRQMPSGFRPLGYANGGTLLPPPPQMPTGGSMKPLSAYYETGGPQPLQLGSSPNEYQRRQSLLARLTEGYTGPVTQNDVEFRGHAGSGFTPEFMDYAKEQGYEVATDPNMMDANQYLRRTNTLNSFPDTTQPAGGGFPPEAVALGMLGSGNAYGSGPTPYDPFEGFTGPKTPAEAGQTGRGAAQFLTPEFKKHLQERGYTIDESPTAMDAGTNIYNPQGQQVSMTDPASMFGSVGPRPPEDLITGRGDYNEATGSIEPYPTAFDPARDLPDTTQPAVGGLPAASPSSTQPIPGRDLPDTAQPTFDIPTIFDSVDSGVSGSGGVVPALDSLRDLAMQGNTDLNSALYGGGGGGGSVPLMRDGGSMGFRPIGVWSNGGLVVPPLNIQSVANIPIQSAANVPLANYQPSTPYVYPDPPATPTPGTTPEGTENTFFAADPDKYTVPTPYGYGTDDPTEPTDPWTWTPSPGWIKRPDGNIYLDESTAPTRYFSQDEQGEDVFNQQKFLQDAYNNQLFQGSTTYRIDEIEEEDDAGDMHSYFRFVRAGGPNWNDGGFVQKSGVPYTQGRNAMPNVMGREFPYTPEGMAAAQQYRQAIGMRDGGMMGFRPIGMAGGGVATPQSGGGASGFMGASSPLAQLFRDHYADSGERGAQTEPSGSSALDSFRREFGRDPRDTSELREYIISGGGGPVTAMRDGGEGGFRPIGMQKGGIATSDVAPDVAAIFKGLVDVTQSGSTQDVAAYIEANRQDLNDMVSMMMLPQGQADFVRNTLNSFAQSPEQEETLRGTVPPEPDRLSKDPAFDMAEEERMAGEREAWMPRSFGGEGFMLEMPEMYPDAQDQPLTPEMAPEMGGNIPRFKPPWMSDPRYKGYFNPDQLNPFFDPNEIEVANGGYITRNMNRGGLMSLRRR